MTMLLDNYGVRSLFTNRAGTLVHFNKSGHGKPPCLTVYLLAGTYTFTDPKDSGLHFDLDVGAKYKAQLAPLSSQARVDWIVNDLSNKPAISFDDYFLIQLAADEGKIASRAAASRLRDMEKHRERYLDSQTGSRGRVHRMFGAYIGVLYIINCVADPEQEPLVAALANDPESYIASIAHKVYRCFQEGVGPQYNINY